MPYLAGVLTGMLLTILAVFVIDHVKAEGETSASEPQKIVNWDVAAQRLSASLGTLKEESMRPHVDPALSLADSLFPQAAKAPAESSFIRSGECMLLRNLNARRRSAACNQS